MAGPLAWITPVWSTSGPDVYSARVEAPTALVVRINLPLAGLWSLHTDIDRGRDTKTETEEEREREGKERQVWRVSAVSFDFISLEIARVRIYARLYSVSISPGISFKLTT